MFWLDLYNHARSAHILSNYSRLIVRSLVCVPFLLVLDLTLEIHLVLLLGPDPDLLP